MNHRTIGTVVFAQSTPKIQIFRARPARHAHAAPHEQFSSQSPPHAHVAQSHIGVGGVVVFVVFVVFVSLVFASRVVSLASSRAPFYRSPRRPSTFAVFAVSRRGARDAAEDGLFFIGLTSCRSESVAVCAVLSFSFNHGTGIYEN